jgi:ribonucleoside-triphosphate reductase
MLNDLTEVVCRREDSLETIRSKLKVASILGTIQSSMTNFKFLSAAWKHNCQEEALLGVSLTGIFDCPAVRDASSEDLQSLRDLTVQVNMEWAEKLGINRSAAITCVKPSGTVSQLVDSASGIHPRHSPYYIRNIRLDDKDPVCKFLRTSGIPNEPDANFAGSQTVFSFPVKAPEGGWTREDITAVKHLDLWKKFQDDYCEHKPSVTISVRDKEWPAVMAWVWDNFDDVSGIAFLPHSDHSYKQAPYIAIGKEEYEALAAKMPKELDWNQVVETDDVTTASQEMACESDRCVIG